MRLFKKNTEPQLDIDKASQILEQIFKANNVPPNTVPLEVLAAYSNYRKERFSLQRTILIIIMVLFLLLPFLFIAPFFSLEMVSDTNGLNPAYEIYVDTFMPVNRVTAVIDGHNLPVYEVATHKYSIEPTLNGTMEVSVTLVNHQTITKQIEIDNVDLEAPAVISNKIDSKNLYLYVSDSGSGVDYECVKGIGLSGKECPPASYDESTGQIIFAYPDESLNIYIPDHADNTLQIVLTVQ